MSLFGMAAAYLAADCHLVSDEGRRQLRCHFKDVRCETKAAAGPKLWNSLPAELQEADISFQRFKLLLKTFLFRC